MLASEAAIVFPALLLLEGDRYYSEALSLDDLTRHRGVGEPRLRDHEIVDSAGQRFLIRGLVNIEPIKAERPNSFWMRLVRRLFPQNPHVRFDLDLEPLPSATFAETLRRVMEKEWAQEAFHLLEGGAPDGPESRERLERCRSIGDIIAIHNPTYRPQDVSTDEVDTPTGPETTLASKAGIAFPALLFRASDDYYDAVPGPENLRYGHSFQMDDFLGNQLVDSAGRRFRIYRFVGIEDRVELRQKRGWLDFWHDGQVYNFDLELESLPPFAFEETHRWVMATEAAMDAAPPRHARRKPRSEMDKQRLVDARSIGDIIACLELQEAGAPPSSLPATPR
jgi:hypothetical protein